ncbi:MAG: SixA phosphatase family protein [Pseudonocardiaceae bacterium]
MARTLILLRHAKSAWPPEVPDVERPLAERGRRDAPAAGRWLRKHFRKIDLVVCSPAIRAAQTCDLVFAEWKAQPKVRHEPRLYGASVPELLQIIQALPSRVSTAVLIGHNPGLEEVLTVLTGVAEPVKTSAIAVIRIPAGWDGTGPGSSALEELALPRG